jgi:hypothetical protein
MATITSLPLQRNQSQGTLRRTYRRISGGGAAWVLACSLLAVGLLGYHPFAEDGGIYATGVTLRLHTELFPAERTLAHSFADAHTSQSLFVPALAALIRLAHAPEETAMLLLFIASLIATLAAALSLARVVFSSEREQRWAVLLLSVSLGLPVAGTSLYLADPYLTARSLWTPVVLYGLSQLLRSRTRLAMFCLALVAPLHPLMTVWAALLFATLLAYRSARRAVWSARVAAVALAVMMAMQMFAPADSAAVRAASLSRGYWFLSRWEWYEWIGLAAAPLLLVLYAMRFDTFRNASARARELAFAAATVAGVATIASLLLIHPGNSSLLLARMQPLRLLHPVYVIFVLLTGGILGSLPRRLRWVPLSACLAAGIGLLSMQRGIYAHSGQWELPGADPVNGYEQAFRWVRTNTPVDAIFATDAEYTNASGEDAQMFRAVARRTVLPDRAKDGGVASVVPALADVWRHGSDLQTGLAVLSDRERVARIRPLGATWILLPAHSLTAFPCPYWNGVAKVCQLP